MPPKDEKFLTDMQQYVMHLRYRLAQYQFEGIAPPVRLLIELKMAERLAKLNSKGVEHINVNV
jgi:hypothetical protein